MIVSRDEKEKRGRFENPSHSSYIDKPPTFTEIETKTYKEEAIEVLNILESSGVNIYDPERYGGMYLKKTSNPEFKKLFSEKKEKKQDIINNVGSEEKLRNFFKSSKK